MSRPRGTNNKTPERILEANRRWRAKPGNEEKKIASTKAWCIRLKFEAMLVYGEGRCACCGESNLAFLTLDHVDNDGAEHRRLLNVGRDRKVGLGGSHLYLCLKKAGWPNTPRLAVMCWNCNAGRRCNGGVCPHEEEWQKRMAECGSPEEERERARARYGSIEGGGG